MDAQSIDDAYLRYFFILQPLTLETAVWSLGLQAVIAYSLCCLDPLD